MTSMLSVSGTYPRSLLSVGLRAGRSARYESAPTRQLSEEREPQAEPGRRTAAQLLPVEATALRVGVKALTADDDCQGITASVDAQWYGAVMLASRARSQSSGRFGTSSPPARWGRSGLFAARRRNA